MTKVQYLSSVLFHDIRDGVFIDIGAHDGTTINNTIFFERELGWNGVCVEPRQAAFEKLQKSRKCFCEQVCISDKEGTADFLEVTDFNNQMLSGLVANLGDERLDRIRRQSDDFKKARTVKVKCVTFSQLATKYGFSE